MPEYCLFLYIYVASSDLLFMFLVRYYYMVDMYFWATLEGQQNLLMMMDGYTQEILVGWMM